MYQKGCPPIHIGAKQAQTFVCRVPRLHYDVVQLVPQKIFHHSFILRLHFQKIRQHAHWSQPSIHYSRLKQTPH